MSAPQSSRSRSPIQGRRNQVLFLEPLLVPNPASPLFYAASIPMHDHVRIEVYLFLTAKGLTEAFTSSAGCHHSFAVRFAALP